MFDKSRNEETAEIEAKELTGGFGKLTNEEFENTGTVGNVVPLEEYEKIVKELELKEADFRDVESLNGELVRKLLLANNNIELINEEKEQIRELAASQKLLVEKPVETSDATYFFWAFINNRTEYILGASLSEVEEYIKNHPRMRHSETFMANAFIGDGLTNDVLLNELIKNTVARLEIPNL